MERCVLISYQRMSAPVLGFLIPVLWFYGKDIGVRMDGWYQVELMTINSIKVKQLAPSGAFLRHAARPIDSWQRLIRWSCSVVSVVVWWFNRLFMIKTSVLIGRPWAPSEAQPTRAMDTRHNNQARGQVTNLRMFRGPLECPGGTRNMDTCIFT